MRLFLLFSALTATASAFSFGDMERKRMGLMDDHPLKATVTTDRRNFFAQTAAMGGAFLLTPSAPAQAAGIDKVNAKLKG